MELRQYQKEDLEKLLTHNAMGCFNEQRTGKTPTAISVMEARNVNKLVIVTTASSVYQWKQEYETWTNKQAIILHGTKQQKFKALATWTDGAVITSYDSFKTTKRSDGLVDKILKKNPQGIIADEAHKIKNHKKPDSGTQQKIMQKIGALDMYADHDKLATFENIVRAHQNGQLGLFKHHDESKVLDYYKEKYKTITPTTQYRVNEDELINTFTKNYDPTKGLALLDERLK